ncbi:MAG: hypothetical protein ACOH5I_26315 [Oligoflexus sp.]
MLDIAAQQKLFTDTLTVAKAAAAFVDKINALIDDNAELMGSIGVSLSLQASTPRGNVGRVDEQELGNAAMETLIRKLPNSSERLRRSLSSEFIHHYGSHKTMLDDDTMLGRFLAALKSGRDSDLSNALEWVRRARTRQGYTFVEKNYDKVPRELRLHATPDISTVKGSWRFRDASEYDSLRNLEIALCHRVEIDLPARLLADAVHQTWEGEFRDGSYEGIKTFCFKCRFFTLRAYRSAADRLTFTDEALAILNGSCMAWKVSDNQPISAPKRDHQPDQDAEHNQTEEVPQSSAICPQQEVTNCEQVEQATDSMAEVTEFEKAWLARRAELRAQVERKERLEKARKAQDEAIAKHAEKIQVPIHYSHKQGVICYGDTKPLKDIFNAHLWGWWHKGKCWYIQRSKGKELSQESVGKIEALVNDLRSMNVVVNLDVSELARAA